LFDLQPGTLDTLFDTEESTSYLPVDAEIIQGPIGISIGPVGSTPDAKYNHLIPSENDTGMLTHCFSSTSCH
jgi:hypothetical protein